MTGQVHEELILDGEMTSMAFCPPVPTWHPRVLARSPDQAVAPEDDDGEVDNGKIDNGEFDRSARRDLIFMSSACWRGYQGTWEVRSGRFYLVGLRGRFRLLGGEPILADWFSGILRVPKGKMLQYVHMGFGTVHEHELHIKITDGIVVATRLIDNRGKEFDEDELAWRNLPGGENRFRGDDEL